MSLTTPQDWPHRCASIAVSRLLLLQREVRVGQAGGHVLDERCAFAVHEPGLGSRLGHQRNQAGDRVVGTDQVRDETSTAGLRRGRPVARRDDGYVGLAVAGVDGQHSPGCGAVVRSGHLMPSRR